MWGQHNGALHNSEVDEATTHLLTVVIPDFAKRMDSEFLVNASTESPVASSSSSSSSNRASLSGSNNGNNGRNGGMADKSTPSIPSVGKNGIADATEVVGFDVTHLAESLHRFGINCRHIGRVRAACHTPQARAALLLEMVSRGKRDPPPPYSHDYG